MEYWKGKYNIGPDAWSRAPMDIADGHFPTCAMVQQAKREMFKDLQISDETILKSLALVNTTLIATKFTILKDKVYRIV